MPTESGGVYLSASAKSLGHHPAVRGGELIEVNMEAARTEALLLQINNALRGRRTIDLSLSTISGCHPHTRSRKRAWPSVLRPQVGVEPLEAIRIINDEHRALAAVLHGMLPDRDGRGGLGIPRIRPSCGR